MYVEVEEDKIESTLVLDSTSLLHIYLFICLLAWVLTVLATSSPHYLYNSCSMTTI
ncbi:UNVERIFIED_CONTAM: hypothetical protein FKN15_061881 [Acipenser sinensis]